MTTLPSIQKLIIMPLGLLLNWTADYEAETARELAKSNIVILFAYGEGMPIWRYCLQPFRLLTKERETLYIFRPLYILPFQRFAITRSINARIASWHLRFIIKLHKGWHALPKIYWSFSLQSVIQPKFFGISYLAIYDCVDICTSAHPGIAKQLKQFEKNVMRQSHVVLTNSASLYALHKHRHKLIIQTKEGLFALNKFSAQPLLPIPPDINALPHPRVVFIGNINTRLNFSLIQKLAAMTPRVSYIFIGRNDPAFIGIKPVSFKKELDRLTQMKNVYFLGEKPKSSILTYISAADIGFVPYDTDHIFNMYSSPMKIQEYFYGGVPVLSTPLREVRGFFPYIRTFRTPKEGEKIIKDILQKRWPSSYKRAQRKIAESNSIEQKIKLVTNALHTHYPHYF